MEETVSVDIEFTGATKVIGVLRHTDDHEFMDAIATILRIAGDDVRLVIAYPDGTASGFAEATDEDLRNEEPDFAVHLREVRRLNG